MDRYSRPLKGSLHIHPASNLLFAPLAFIIKKNVGASVNGTTSIL
jgi:hypothetical protein